LVCGGSLQCTTVGAIHPAVILNCFPNLNVIDPIANNMFTLMGFKNMGVVFQNDGYVNVDDIGSTVISVGSQGVLIDDILDNHIFLGGGTHTYNGAGTGAQHIYETDSFFWKIGTNVAFVGTDDKDGDEFGKVSLPSGALTFKTSIDKFAISFDRFTLPNFPNTIDLGQVGVGSQIIAKGFGDVVLLGQEKFFPILIRNVLKGDSLIVYNKNVKVLEKYIAKDAIYNYEIISDGVSTKVFAKNGKIIQDSDSLPLDLTPRQRSLVYN